ncbi:hypothetical protein JTE90_027176 [Oedothorax gibbosus]|uniref:Uncharacterized protein n=1 Tax=Oedothorax gibbosus TaxID=931172 RepID=A0AAV6TI94_9ARAC|nr:hypothetical protein JTE90_027176 [Oedothorax gibbosus]
MDCAIAMYRGNDILAYHISPSPLWYPVIVKQYILPHVDLFTTLTVQALEDYYIPFQLVEIKFRLYQENPKLFVVVECEDFHFLEFYMWKNEMIADDMFDVIENFLWTEDALYEIMIQKYSNFVTITKDDHDVPIFLTDFTDEYIRAPEQHCLIGHIGQRAGFIRNPLVVLSSQQITNN